MTERYDGTEQEAVQEPVVVRDRRKIDPETGQLREQPTEVPSEEGTPGPQLGEETVDESVAPASDLERQLEERTADLQRLQAEYANYRRRVDRDKESVAEGGKAAVVNELLPLLDDLERAESHGDLTGAFKAVADKFVGALERVGLESFGKEGEPFDPSVHEAVQHSTSPDVAGPTVTMVLRRGYRLADRVLREALVGVTDHEPGGESAADGPVDPPVGGELPIDADEHTR
ncbi:nucleotide exchange factor GrpE [Prauserella marina]|uniref:Protein GrpE n=1 Tax=Prauserella marina TaxID=530584 RepID=A0A222VXR4_9PSEU|nr:nucleotide exchange factor GrpE [Prauserella marina]ASR38680.1 nucleotide exchange factor GrpE [Prauserella marina]PWV82016.1 molecular chaperone GrpE [Prauserella marina]SDD17517.1 molecular chaperone GrpE [Prauserella marina]